MLRTGYRTKVDTCGMDVEKTPERFVQLEAYFAAPHIHGEPAFGDKAATSRCRYHESAAACARKPRSTPRCVTSCGRFAFFFPPPNPPLVSTLPNLGKNGRKKRFDSGGKLVECRLFRVVVSHGKVGSDALCILLNFLWADKATVRHEPQRINTSGKDLQSHREGKRVQDRG